MFTSGPRAEAARVGELLLMFMVAPHLLQVHTASELPRASRTCLNGDFILRLAIRLGR